VKFKFTFAFGLQYGYRVELDIVFFILAKRHDRTPKPVEYRTHKKDTPVSTSWIHAILRQIRTLSQSNPTRTRLRKESSLDMYTDLHRKKVVTPAKVNLELASFLNSATTTAERVSTHFV
jgi:hypothetical protein